MPSYCLLLDATIGAANVGNGDFNPHQTSDRKPYVGTWVCPTDDAFNQADCTALKVNNGDQVTFAVRILGPNGGVGNPMVKWLAATIDDTTDNPALIDSPFRLPNGGVWPLIIANSTQADGALALCYYDNRGRAVPTPVTPDNTQYIGLPYLTVRDSGAFEVVIAAEVVGSVDGQSVWFQLSHDPEMDNGKGSF